MNDRIQDYIAYHPVRTQRGLEILTGLVPWLIILFPLIGSFFIPEFVAYFIIAFNVYWLYRSVQMAIYGTAGYLNIKASAKLDWFKKLSEDPKTKDRFKEIRHVIILCNYKEALSILERNLDSLLAQNFPTKNIFIVLAQEQREGEPARQRSVALTEKYGKKFGLFMTTSHILVPGETVGKHSNETFAAKAVKNELSKMNILSENVVVTTSDADAVFDHQYISYLTFKFLTEPNPHSNFYQAPLFMYNNIDRVPLMVRIPSIISGIYFLSILQKQSKRFLNYSTYSMSLKLLEDVDYWDVEVIPEDAHIFYKAFFQLHGKVQVVPIYAPISIDAAEAKGIIATYKNSYQQNVRWAWGATDIPYVIKKFFQHPEIPLWDRLLKITFALEWHFVWSSSWFLLTVGANIPTFVNPVFARTTLGLNLSRVSSFILTLALIGIISILFIDILLNPKYKSKVRKLLHPFTYLQWAIFPVTGLLFGSLPGLESQTRLMLGKYLEYRVMEKESNKK